MMNRSNPYRNISILLALFVLLNPVFPADAAATANEETGMVIVLDPGHGGNDSGASGADGIEEKTITLILAQMTAALLKDRFRVELTRNDDYAPDLFNRTGKANNLDADLFISLHTGGSFVSTAKGAVIFCHEPSDAPNLRTEFPSDATDDAAPQARRWATIQERHHTASMAFAKAVQESLINSLENLTVRIRNAPVAVLMGTDMPAVLIEIGYLSHPVEGKRLQDRNILAAYARAIADAAAEFLTKNQNPAN